MDFLDSRSESPEVPEWAKEHAILPTRPTGVDSKSHQKSAQRFLLLHSLWKRLVKNDEELQELYQYITKFHPQDVDIETLFQPFIPDYIPAIGDIDAMLKVS
jgi:intraflagellar transport protein 46